MRSLLSRSPPSPRAGHSGSARGSRSSPPAPAPRPKSRRPRTRDSRRSRRPTGRAFRGLRLPPRGGDRPRARSHARTRTGTRIHTRIHGAVHGPTHGYRPTPGPTHRPVMGPIVGPTHGPTPGHTAGPTVGPTPGHSPMVGSTHILTQRPPKPISPATAAPQQCRGVTPIPNPYSHPPFPVPTPTLCGWPGVPNVFAPSDSFASAGFNGINLRWASGSSVLASCPGGLLEDFAAVQWQNRAADSARWGPGAGWLHIGQFNPVMGKIRDTLSQQLVSRKKIRQGKQSTCFSQEKKSCRTNLILLFMTEQQPLCIERSRSCPIFCV